MREVGVDFTGVGCAAFGYEIEEELGLFDARGGPGRGFSMGVPFFERGCIRALRDGVMKP